MTTIYDANTLYEILQSKKSSGSGAGVSSKSVAASCGRKAHLKEQYPEVDSDDDYEVGATTATGRRKVNGRRAGVFFHALQELWRTGGFPADAILDATEHVDYDYETAVRSFRNYRARFGNDPNNLGRVVAVEKKYPETPEQEALIREALGDIPFTMR